MLPSSLAFVKPAWDVHSTYSVQVRRASARPETRIEERVSRLNPPDSIYVELLVLILTVPSRVVHLVRRWPDRRRWLLLVYRGTVTSHRPGDATECLSFPTKQLAQESLRQKATELAGASDPPARVTYS